MLESLGKPDPELAVTGVMHADHPAPLASLGSVAHPTSGQGDFGRPLPGNSDRFLDRPSTLDSRALVTPAPETNATADAGCRSGGVSGRAMSDLSAQRVERPRQLIMVVRGLRVPELLIGQGDRTAPVRRIEQHRPGRLQCRSRQRQHLSNWRGINRDRGDRRTAPGDHLCHQAAEAVAHHRRAPLQALDHGHEVIGDLPDGLAGEDLRSARAVWTVSGSSGQPGASGAYPASSKTSAHRSQLLDRSHGPRMNTTGRRPVALVRSTCAAVTGEKAFGRAGTSLVKARAQPPRAMSSASARASVASMTAYSASSRK